MEGRLLGAPAQGGRTGVRAKRAVSRQRRGFSCGAGRHPASAPRLTGNLLGELPLPSGSLQHAPSITANIFSWKSINQIRQWQSRDGQMKSSIANPEHRNFSASNNFPEPCHSLPSSFLPPVPFFILTHYFQ